MRYLLALVIVALAASPAAAGPGINIAKDNTLQGTGASTAPLGLAACLVAGQTWVWNGTAFACASAGAGGITNGAAANVITKSDGTNLVASSVSDDATTLTVGAGKVTITEASGNTTIAGTLTADATHRVFDVAGTGLLGATNTVSLNMAGGTCAAGTVGSALGATGTLTCTAIGTQGGTTGTGTAGNLAAWNGSTTALGNFAGSSPTACAAGQVLTRVTTAATGAVALTCTAIGTAGGITGSALTTNQTVKATGATAIGNAWAVDDGTTWGVASKYTITEATGATHDFGAFVADGATTLNGLTTIQNSGTTTTLVPLSITRTDAATLGDITELDIGQTTAQGSITTSTTNIGDLSGTLGIGVRWFNGTNYINHDLTLGSGGATFDGTDPGFTNSLVVKNQSNTAGTTTDIATSDGTGDLLRISSDNAGSTTRFKTVARNTAQEFWTGASGGAVALTLDGGQKATFSNNLVLSQAGDTYFYDSLATTTGTQNLNINAAGTGVVRVGSSTGSLANPGTGGLEVTGPINALGPINSTTGANTLGETEDNMTTASNSSGTLTDISFPRTARGVLWTITGGLTADGMGFTSGTPTDGQNFKICVIGGGSLVLPHENAGETTVGRRFNFQINVPQVVRSGGCQDLTYDATSARWHRRDNGIASFNATANVITKYTGNYELQSSGITDTGSLISWGESTTLTAPTNATSLTINKALTAQTTDGDNADISNTSTWNTTAAAHTTYGLHVSCANSISSGANALNTPCGYFTNSSSGANINAWALVTDVGDVKFNLTSGSTLAHGAFGVDGLTTLNTLTDNGAATLNGGVTVNTGSLNINSGAFVNAGLVDSDLTHITDKDGTNRPTIANCGTTAPTVVGTDTSGWFITAAGITTSCAITFHAAYSSNVDCNSWITGAGTTVASPNLTIATSGLTFAGSAGPLSTGLKVHWECRDH